MLPLPAINANETTNRPSVSQRKKKKEKKRKKKKTDQCPTNALPEPPNSTLYINRNANI